MGDPVCGSGTGLRRKVPNRAFGPVRDDIGARRKFSTKECRDGAFNYGRRDLTSDMLMCSLTGWR